MSKSVTFLRKLFLLSDEEIQINAIKLREVIPPDNSTLVKLRESVTKLQSKNVFFFPKLQLFLLTLISPTPSSPKAGKAGGGDGEFVFVFSAVGPGHV